MQDIGFLHDNLVRVYGAGTRARGIEKQDKTGPKKGKTTRITADSPRNLLDFGLILG